MPIFVIDLILLAVLLVSVLRGWHIGFILTVCGLLASVVALVGAVAVSNTLAGPMSQLIEPGIEAGLRSALTEALPAGTQGEEAVQAAQRLPLGSILPALEDNALYRSLAESFQTAVQRGTEGIVGSAVESLSAFAARELSRLFLFFVSFVLILVGWQLLSHGLDLVSKLPVLNQTNRTLGAAIGLVRGNVLLFIAAWLVEGRLLPRESIEQSILLRFFCDNSPQSLWELAKTLTISG